MTAIEQLAALFPTIARCSWRWECQGEYQVDAAKLDRWRRGMPFQERPGSLEWHAFIRSLLDRGIPFARVRMLTDTVAQHRAYRNAVWPLAIRHEDYPAKAERHPRS